MCPGGAVADRCAGLVSVNSHLDDGTLERAALAFDNPDHVDVVIHSYSHHLGLAPGMRHIRSRRRDVPNNRSFRCQRSHWMVWLTATSPQPTALCQQVTSRVRASMTRYRTPGTTCRKKHQRRSLMRPGRSEAHIPMVRSQIEPLWHHR